MNIITKIRKDKRTRIEKEIDKHLDILKDLDYDSEEYASRLHLIERLKIVNGDTQKKQLSPDTILVVIGGLIQVGAILYREEIGHVVSSKAASFVMRGRV